MATKQMKRNTKIAKRLHCVLSKHKWVKVPNTPNMYICKRCKEPGWMV